MLTPTGFFLRLRKSTLIVISTLSVFIATFSYANQHTISKLYDQAFRGDVDAQYELGKKLIEGVEIVSDAESGLEWITSAAEKNHSRAQFMLGMTYYFGKLIPENRALAIQWVKKAADNNLVQAQYILGGMFHTGYTEKNLAKAAKYFTMASNQGYVKGHVALATMYETGKYFPKSEKRAAKLYKKAAEQSNLLAQILLGGMYEDGRGVTRDYKKAMYWYTEAAGQGDAKAQWLIGMMHLNGRGVQTSVSSAKAWLNRSCVNGFEQACSDLRKLPQNQKNIDARAPSINKAGYDLFKSTVFQDGKQKYKTAHDQLTRFWVEEDFQLKGIRYHTKFFATQHIDNHTGEPYSAHVTGATVSVITYRQKDSGQWEVVSAQKGLTESGSWGDIYSDNYLAEKLSPSSYGLLFEFGYTAQGQSEGGRLIYVFHKDKWHYAGFIPEEGSYGDASACELYKECSEYENAYSFTGEIYIGETGKSTGFPDLLVVRTGTVLGGNPAKNTTYRFDGNQYKELLAQISQPSAGRSNQNTDSKTDHINSLHDKMEKGISGANIQMAGKKTDEFTTIKSIRYDRKIPEVIYTYYENPKITRLGINPANIINTAKQTHIKMVCDGPFSELMRALRFKVTHNYEGLVSVTIYPEDCE